MNSNKKAAREIIKSLKNEPYNWKFEEKVATYRKEKYGFVLWISNGWFSISVYKPFEMGFSLIDRYRISKAIVDCKSIQLINLITNG